MYGSALYTVDSPMLQQLKKMLKNICSACSYQAAKSSICSRVNPTQRRNRNYSCSQIKFKKSLNRIGLEDKTFIKNIILKKLLPLHNYSLGK